MPLKINDFIIQAKVLEEGSSEYSPAQEDVRLPASVKKEIIDECMERLKEYLERDRYHE